MNTDKKKKPYLERKNPEEWREEFASQLQIPNWVQQWQQIDLGFYTQQQDSDCVTQLGTHVGPPYFCSDTWLTLHFDSFLLPHLASYFPSFSHLYYAPIIWDHTIFTLNFGSAATRVILVCYMFSRKRFLESFPELFYNILYKKILLSESKIFLTYFIYF